ncbi:MAG TPA: hypothetical protein VFM88_02350 [Vicinamibacteria bacterium]|nr:hypothetical protein [Vicinamibacteria bacterium]
MQEALQAAVARMNSGSSESRSSPMEALAPLLTMLPALLQNRDSGEDVGEKIDELRKGELATLRDEVHVLRKQCSRLMKAQQQALARMRDLQRQQAVAADAVLELARQMARITFVGAVPDEDDDQRDIPLATESTLWARNGSSRGMRSRDLREAIGRARP